MNGNAIGLIRNQKFGRPDQRDRRDAQGRERRLASSVIKLDGGVNPASWSAATSAASRRRENRAPGQPPARIGELKARPRHPGRGETIVGVLEGS